MSLQLEVENVSVSYGDFIAVREASLALAAGEIGCLLGPSGCGKTSLLRAIAGFEPVTTGSISLHGSELSNPTLTVPPEKRRVGMVFQDFALFPHLTVAQNIRFGLSGRDKSEQAARVTEMLALVDLPDSADKFPHQLSGGQQQRVALARALAPAPEILLLDEPFSSLDTELRESLASEVRALLKATGVTAIVVTHDQQEAFAIADSITLMQDGAVIQSGTARELYERPAVSFVADFVGQGAVIEIGITEQGELDHSLGRLDPGQLSVGSTRRLHLLVRPGDVRFDSASAVQFPVVTRAFRGDHFLYTLRLPDGQTLPCQAPTDIEIEIDERLPVRLSLTRVTHFPVD